MEKPGVKPGPGERSGNPLPPRRKKNFRRERNVRKYYA